MSKFAVGADAGGLGSVVSYANGGRKAGGDIVSWIVRGKMISATTFIMQIKIFRRKKP